MRVAIFWFRRDLRLRDNTALDQAIRENDVVWPVFILDPEILEQQDFGGASVAFMLDCLASLAEGVKEAGGTMLFRHGPPLEELRQLARASHATGLYFNRDYDPFARARDEQVKKAFIELGLEVKTANEVMIHEPDEVLKTDQSAYRIFTPYRHVWERVHAAHPAAKPLGRARFSDAKAAASPAPGHLPTLKSLGFTCTAEIQRGGEEEAHQVAAPFFRSHVGAYEKERNFPAIEGTSRLSPHLRFGTISVRELLANAERVVADRPDARQGATIFIQELAWRDFFRQLLWHFPNVATESFRPEFRNLKWENDREHFAAWCEGRTGYPIVDAAMRQLNAIGWMHNRLRMVVASFLCKDLLVDWKWGERYFIQRLMDGDLAANNGGWQWSAGTGADAQPYFRIFNPTAQAEKFDPEGTFIEHWIPEINDPKKYPKPIVDHREQKEKALAMYRATLPAKK